MNEKYEVNACEFKYSDIGAESSYLCGIDWENYISWKSYKKLRCKYYSPPKEYIYDEKEKKYYKYFDEEVKYDIDELYQDGEVCKFYNYGFCENEKANEEIYKKIFDH